MAEQQDKNLLSEIDEESDSTSTQASSETVVEQEQDNRDKGDDPVNAAISKIKQAGYSFSPMSSPRKGRVTTPTDPKLRRKAAAPRATSSSPSKTPRGTRHEKLVPSTEEDEAEESVEAAGDDSNTWEELRDGMDRCDTSFQRLKRQFGRYNMSSLTDDAFNDAFVLFREKLREVMDNYTDYYDASLQFFDENAEKESYIATTEVSIDAQHSLLRDVLRYELALKTYRRMIDLKGSTIVLQRRSSLTAEREQTTLTTLQTELSDITSQVSRLKIDKLDATLEEVSRLVIREVEKGQSQWEKVAKRDTPAPVKISSIAHAPVREPTSLPTFEGSILKWKGFWDLFSAIMARTSGLEDAEKLCYLVSSMGTPDLKELVEEFVAEAGTYDGTVKLLRERFEHDQEIFRYLMSKVNKFQPCERTQDALERTVRQINGLISTFKRCGGFSAEQMLCHFCEDALPSRTLDAWRTATAAQAIAPTVQELLTFMKQQAATLYQRKPLTEDPTHRTKQHGNSRGHKQPAARQEGSSTPPPRTAEVSRSNQRSDTCSICNRDHYIIKCPDFARMPVEQRHSKVNMMGLCLNCLSSKHSVTSCKNSKRCVTCKGKHHTMIHISDFGGNKTSGTIPQSGHSDAMLAYSSTRNHHTANGLVVPPTAMATMLGANGLRQARTLLDTGCSESVISNKLANRLGAKRLKGPGTNITGLSYTQFSPYDVTFTLKGTHIDRQVDIVAHVVDELPKSRQPRDMSKIYQLPMLKDLQLADPHRGHTEQLDMILSDSDIYRCISRKHIYSDEHPFAATETIFGWVIGGKFKCDVPADYSPEHICLHMSRAESPPVDDLRMLWEMEKCPGQETTLKADELLAVQHFKTTHQRDSDGRYRVALPRKPNATPLGKSRDIAIHRARQTQRSLEKKGLVEATDKALAEYHELGHAEKIPWKEIRKQPNECNYLPRHPVFKSSSTTTKTRIVFDASAKTSNGTSFNDTLLPGPSLYPKLTTIIIRFRDFPIAISADISKMFREIGLLDEEKDYHRYILLDGNGKVIDMRMSRLTFGVTSSPYLATQVLHQLAKDHGPELPTAAQTLRKEFYVDDCLTGASTVEEAKSKRCNLNQLLGKGCMTLRKWRSNCKEVLKSIPQELCETETTLSIGAPDQWNKALGVHWDTANDTLHIVTPAVDRTKAPTKRIVASVLAKVYDPLGWHCAAILPAKVLLKRLWVDKVGWDEVIPEQYKQEWWEWVAALPDITKCPIPRHYTSLSSVSSRSLHVFSDASILGLGGVVYIRTKDDASHINVTLVSGKNKATPITPTTIPRMELEAARIAAELAVAMAKVLDIPVSDVYAWSDSSAVLGWINNQSGKLPVFVSNRVSIISSNIPAGQWRYVATADNPADLLSRGISPSAIKRSTLWWKGPPWLSTDVSQWPRRQEIDRCRTLPESALLMGTTNEPPYDERVSSLCKLVRAVAWVRRLFHHWLKLKPPDDGKRLSLTELRWAKRAVLRASQRQHFPDTYQNLQRGKPVCVSDPLHKYRPSLLEDCLIRVRGRDIKSTNASGITTKHPIILSPKAHTTKLLVRQVHIDSCHGGPTVMMAILAAQYMIPAAKRMVSKVSSDCIVCRRVYAKTLNPETAALPAARVSQALPFSIVGLDYAGPFLYCRGNMRKPTMVRCYVCVIICFATKATHLELVHSLEAAEFIKAMQRFVDVRGKPADVYSDNGSNFRAADRDLRQVKARLQEEGSQGLITVWAAQQDIRWHFIPARAPHFGGLWEASVKKMKLCLRKVVGQEKLNLSELLTVVSSASASLNSRPLVAINSMSDDGIEPLTPGHFITGRALKSIPVPVDGPETICDNKRWNLVETLRQRLWRRWATEYLASLKAYNRNHNRHPGKDLRKGDVVLVKDNCTFQHYWPLALVMETHPGTDGVVRAVQLRLNGKPCERAARNLVLLVRPEADDLTTGESVQVSDQNNTN